ncbi:MAG TPA: hypothetical protein PKI03_02720 [Pseudomonadota bacterium]|nr:hypothetical protein [Pseudomonadota bacterium]
MRLPTATTGLRLLLSCSLFALACAPATQSTEGTPPDLAGVERDMAPVCTTVTGNLLTNPGFEASLMGSTTNLGAGSSTIPGWRGCCGTTQTTTYDVVSSQRYCGERSVSISSSQGATSNVLIQDAMRGSDVGKTFLVSAWLNVTSVGAGGEIGLDVFDNGTPKAVVAPTVSLKNPTNGWFELRASGTVPTGGNLQVRITSSGTIQAYADELVFRIP